MFRWYQASVVCYAYLSDVSRPRLANSASNNQKLRRSRWFTRGWTLQELLAPTRVVFYSSDWVELGTRSSLSGLVSSITTIVEGYLSGDNLKTASVAERMSWAAHRQTSRSEDVAYSLLGIFGVHMPLLYGEGRVAFRRLQVEIMKAYPHDHTLFVWGSLVDRSSLAIESNNTRAKDVSWDARKAQESLLWMLAESPVDFESSGSFSPLPDSEAFYHFFRRPQTLPIEAGRGVCLDLPVYEARQFRSVHQLLWPKIVQYRRLVIAILLCSDFARGILPVGLPLQGCGSDSYARTREMIMLPPVGAAWALQDLAQRFYVEPQSDVQLQSGDFLIREVNCVREHWELLKVNTSSCYWLNHSGIVRTQFSLSCTWGLYFQLRGLSRPYGFSIWFDTARREKALSSSTIVSFFPTNSQISEKCLLQDGITWYKNNMTIADVTPLFQHVIEPSGGAWVVNQSPFPILRVGVERVALNEMAGYVDVVDIDIVDGGAVPLLACEWQSLATTSLGLQDTKLEHMDSISARAAKRRRLGL